MIVRHLFFDAAVVEPIDEFLLGTHQAVLLPALVSSYEIRNVISATGAGIIVVYLGP